MVQCRNAYRAIQGLHIGCEVNRMHTAHMEYACIYIHIYDLSSSLAARRRSATGRYARCCSVIGGLAHITYLHISTMGVFVWRAVRNQLGSWPTCRKPDIYLVQKADPVLHIRMLARSLARFKICSHTNWHTIHGNFSQHIGYILCSEYVRCILFSAKNAPL